MLERAAFGRPVLRCRLARVETARLIIRPIEEGDVAALTELDGFAEVRAAVDPFGEHLPEDRAALSAHERGLVGNPGFLAVVERATGAVLGWLQFQARPERPGERELGYRLRPDAWGKGYATEGAAALIREAFASPGVTRVYAHALLDNPASTRVMEKIGMTYARPWEYKGLSGAEYEALAAKNPASVDAGGA
jgi:RimJ/RimL family protein N-acetyltransferase